MGLLSAIGTVAGTFFGGPVGAAIGGAIGGALDGSRSAKKAGGAQQQGVDNSLALQKEQADRAYLDQAPYRKEGVNALSQLALGINTPTSEADVMRDPGYQFGLDQGQQRIDRQIAAGGGRVSGQAIKAAARFGVNYATSGYGAADQRRENRLARLQTLAGLGQSATTTTGQNGMRYGESAGGLMVARGENDGYSRLAQGNIWGNAVNKISSLYQGGGRTDTSSFRSDDPYLARGYFGGEEGE